MHVNCMNIIFLQASCARRVVVTPGSDFTSVFNNNNCVLLKSEERQILQAKCVRAYVRARVQWLQ